MTLAQCNPGNVLAELAHLKDRRGDEFDLSGVVDDLESAGQALFHKLTAEVNAKKIANTPVDKAVDAMVGSFADARKNVKSILSEKLTPAEILGEDVVKPVIDYMNDHAAQFGWKSEEGRLQYLQDVIDLNDGLLERASKNMSVEKYEYLRAYQKYLKDGGPLYHPNGEIGNAKRFLQGISNNASNAIALSNNVFSGNVVETLVKIPTEVGVKPFGEAVAAVMKDGGKLGLWRKIPQLEKEHAYGFAREHDGSLTPLGKIDRMVNKGIEKFQNLTDIPFKNIAYYAGEMRDGKGGGFKMVEKLANIPRLGNEPMMKWTASNKALSRFSHYTLGIYKMYGGWWHDALKGDKEGWRKLVTFHSLVTALGGVGANIPAPVADSLLALNPEWEDEKPWFLKTHGFGRLIQLGSIPLYVPVSMAVNQSEKIGRGFAKIGKYASEGDAYNAMLEGFQTAYKVLPFTNIPAFGLKPVQTVVNNTIDIAQEEIDWDEYWKRTKRGLQVDPNEDYRK